MNKILHLIAQSLSESSSLISSRIGLVQFPFLSSSFVNRSSSSPIASFSGESLKRLSTFRRSLCEKVDKPTFFLQLRSGSPKVATRN